jgi:PAS domain S-box-containing protein
MTSREQPTQALYEIALAISSEESIEETASRALSTYLEQLNCAAGAVLERQDDGTVAFEIVTSVPADPATDETLTAALDRLSDVEAGGVFSDLLPITGRTNYDAQYRIMELPDCGVLILCSEDGGFGATATELEPLNEKLAEACQNTRFEGQLREERNRFETVFEAIQEPAVNVEFDGEQPLVKRVNSAFEKTFGYTEAEALGRDLNELILPDDPTIQKEARQLDTEAIRSNSVLQEVKRETADGIGHFLFRAAPVEIEGTVEHFGLYVDITEEKTRQRTLEALYRDTEEILAGRDQRTICQRAVEATEEIIDLSLTGIHLYDRNAEALVPVATTNEVNELHEGSPDPYTDRDTVVWNAYDTGEVRKIDDVAEFDGTIPGGETPMQSSMILPLGDHGVFIVSSLEANAFDTTDFQFARLLSTTVNIALDRAHREQGLEGVQEITQDMLAADSHEAVAAEVLERVPDLLDLPLSAIWRYDAGKDALVPLAATDKVNELMGDISLFPEGNSTVWNVWESGETDVVEDIRDRPDVYDPDMALRSEIVAPIGDFGVLATGSTRTESFTESEQRLVETLASNVETAMRLVSRRRELELLDQVLGRILRHNLRNDLTVVQGFATTIKDASDDQVAAQAQRIIDRCEDLAATASHASEMREIVRERDRTVTVELDDAIEHAATAARSDFPDAEISVDLEATPQVVAHPAISTAIRHLITNGLEHNDGSPRVEASVLETHGDTVVEIRDNGPGIPDGELGILSQHGESALEHGSGAGLWIIDRVVDYSDATIEFETDDGTTARIIF